MDFSGAWQYVDRLLAILKPAIDLVVGVGVAAVVVGLLVAVVKRFA